MEDIAGRLGGELVKGGLVWPLDAFRCTEHENCVTLWLPRRRQDNDIDLYSFFEMMSRVSDVDSFGIITGLIYFIRKNYIETREHIDVDQRVN